MYYNRAKAYVSAHWTSEAKIISINANNKEVKLKNNFNNATFSMIIIIGKLSAKSIPGVAAPPLLVENIYLQLNISFIVDLGIYYIEGVWQKSSLICLYKQLSSFTKISYETSEGSSNVPYLSIIYTWPVFLSFLPQSKDIRSPILNLGFPFIILLSTSAENRTQNMGLEIPGYIHLTTEAI